MEHQESATAGAVTLPVWLVCMIRARTLRPTRTSTPCSRGGSRAASTRREPSCPRKQNWQTNSAASPTPPPGRCGHSNATGWPGGFSDEGTYRPDRMLIRPGRRLHLRPASALAGRPEHQQDAGFAGRPHNAASGAVASASRRSGAAAVSGHNESHRPALRAPPSCGAVPERDLRAAALRQHPPQHRPDPCIHPRAALADISYAGPRGRDLVVFFHKAGSASRPPRITSTGSCASPVPSLTVTSPPKRPYTAEPTQN